MATLLISKSNSSRHLELQMYRLKCKHVQVDGTSSPGYAAWLRLPKVLRAYRMLRVYRDFRKSVAQTSVTVGILRLMPLILGITHILGCVWWYMGTVGQPRTLEELDALGGIKRGTWVFFYEGMGEAHLWSDSVRLSLNESLHSFPISTLTNARVFSYCQACARSV